MGNDSDDIVSLPSPPPPRPAARQAAIETALRKFDGIEEHPAAGPRRGGPWRIPWSTLRRRPAGGLIAVAIIAVVSVPAIQIVLRNPPPGPAIKANAPTPEPDQAMAEDASPAPGPAPAQDEPADMVAKPPPTQPAATSEVRARGDAASEELEVTSPPPAMMTPAQRAEAPPPPPPPPSPRASEQLAAEDDGIVVTGSRLARPTLNEPSPVTIVGVETGFLSRLQAALASGDRPAVIALVGFPLRVNFGGERVTYRTAGDVERDFDRIFTPQVRLSVRNQRPGNWTSREGGRLVGNGRLWFGCSKSPCPADAQIRIREVSP